MYYSVAVHAYSTDNNYFVKIAISALRLTELTIQAVKPKCLWVVREGGGGGVVETSNWSVH